MLTRNPDMNRKVFAYVTMQEDRSTYLLVFESQDEPGFEVPKGAVEPGEDLRAAVHREAYEESGLTDLEIIQKLGMTIWKNEEQHFFLARIKNVKREEFEHQVTGVDFDQGFRYKFKWIRIESGIDKALVQGCDRFVDELISVGCDD
jgi:8-oxo-dGTP pyrophosphatase MutT (NUDIX family)